MAYTVGELAKLTGVTVRALHHYDEIGLVPASERSAAGYRLYTERDIVRLHRVLLLRELGLPLDEIGGVLDAGDASLAEVLGRHRETLVTRRAQLDAMIAAIDAMEKGAAMSDEIVKKLFEGFDPNVYDEEARARWGDTEAYRESARRTKGYSATDWARYRDEAAAVAGRLVALMHAGRGVSDPEVQAAVEEHRLLIDRWFYPCSVAMHRQLGAMYVSDDRFARNLDALAAGYAAFLSAAIAAR